MKVHKVIFIYNIKHEEEILRKYSEISKYKKESKFMRAAKSIVRKMCTNGKGSQQKRVSSDQSKFPTEET